MNWVEKIVFISVYVATKWERGMLHALKATTEECLISFLWSATFSLLAELAPEAY